MPDSQIKTARLLMIGDVVGDAGIEVIQRYLGSLITNYTADFVVVNGENAAGGFGLTETTLQALLKAGADLVTSGNHIWEKRDFWPILETNPFVLRPGNYPGTLPGKGYIVLEKAGVHWCVINLQGREFMTAIDCPFRTLDRYLAGLEPSRKYLTVIDFHAESPQEKEALALYVDGRVGVIAGTHTHVQTADQRILPKGTAYITDLGMTGVEESIIGMDKAICLERNRTQIPLKMELAKGSAIIHGIIVELDIESGLARSIERLRYPC
ncbi:TIGR00282 family metallophosphoesterase [Gracilinema caldarium]|uniref:Ser/Thr protein phosphatase family protein n=1 Tax=Gracilinema caldarium (strain ATCC 51460 / DSM 7334 / H1) TaxID=744872 RepID=F8F164_GRAC1|nr:TIGR00282 family metallophosphoesterase [Gracilinema caldarium]AEJ20854.1 Ser/Thr protein phosphatase family protein [Gracilinema caldarium DSM 7334]